MFFSRPRYLLNRDSVNLVQSSNANDSANDSGLKFRLSSHTRGVLLVHCAVISTWAETLGLSTNLQRYTYCSEIKFLLLMNPYVFRIKIKKILVQFLTLSNKISRLYRDML